MSNVTTMNSVPRTGSGTTPPPISFPDAMESDTAMRRDEAALEEYLVEYLCRERIGADEIKELLVSEAFLNLDY